MYGTERFIDPERAAKYAYKSINNSLADRYVLRHWWPVAGRLIPAGMHPNLITLIGHLASWTAFAILAGAFGPMATVGRRHPQVFLLVAALYFFYQTMDALDGIQARKTGMLGPLGEFLDHWLDSFTVFLLPLGVLTAFPVLPPLATAAVILVFAGSNWIIMRELLDSGTLVFERFSTEEVQILTQLFFVSIAVFGYDFWAGSGGQASTAGATITPIRVFLALGVGLVVIGGIRSARTSMAGHLALMLAGLAPVVVWTALASRSAGGTAVLLGGLLLGFSGTRFTGEIIRERIVGTAYPVWFPDLVVVDILLLASVLVPGLPAQVPIAVAAASLLWTAITLAIQFRRTVARVEKLCGTGLLGPVGKKRA